MADAPQYIDATKLTLDEWLLLLDEQSVNSSFISNRFPTRFHRDEYITTIRDRSEVDIRGMLYKLLVHSGRTELDAVLLKGLRDLQQRDPNELKRSLEKQYYRRLILNTKWPEIQPWEGITWVLDLLPHSPRVAIEAINAYLFAQFYALPDAWISGLWDAVEIIRAYYIGLPGTFSETVSSLIDIGSRSFEHLIERLYSAMGYETLLTPRTKDGGRDVIAERHDSARREKILIECKLQSSPVPVETVRALLGVVADEKATKGVLVTNNTFTTGYKSATEFVVRNPNLETIDGDQLVRLLNEYLGAKWPQRIDKIIQDSQKSCMPPPVHGKSQINS